MKSKVIMLIIVFFQAGLLFSENTINETGIYNALKTHIDNLKRENDFKAAIHVLEGFIKLHPSSKYLPNIFLEKGKIMLENLNIVKEGYFYIEKVESFKKEDLQKEIDKLKNQYGNIITKERITELVFYIEKYFFIELKFPQSLKDLALYFKISDKLSLIDGYGKTINYILKDNEFIKGEDYLYFDVFSSGKDLLENTDDDIYYISDKTDKIDIKFIQANKIESRWTADVEYFDEKHGVILKKNVKEGDLIKSFIVFGIRENGLIVTKDRESYVFKKE